MTKRYTRYRRIVMKDFKTNTGNLVKEGTNIYISVLGNIGSLGIYDIDQSYLGTLHNIDINDEEYFVSTVEELLEKVE